LLAGGAVIRPSLKMTILNQELYEALVAAGAPDYLAKRAAASILSQLLSELATQAELKNDISHLDTRLAIIEARLSHVEAVTRRVERLLWALVLGVILLLARPYLGVF
jgi:hypothetical protein